MTSTKVKGPPSRAPRRRAGESVLRVTVTHDDGQSGVDRGSQHAEAEQALHQLREKHGELPGQPELARLAPPTLLRGEHASLFNGFGLTKKELAQTIGVAPETLYKSRRLGAAKTQ